MSLSGTPLNEALVSLNQLIPQFKNRTGVQKVQCITLTDGEAHPISFSKEFEFKDHERKYMGSRSTHSGAVFIRDKSNGKTHNCGNNYSHEFTSALLNQLRGRFTDVNFIGIRVMDGRVPTHSSKIHVIGIFDKSSGLQQQWKKDKSLKSKMLDTMPTLRLSSHALGNDTDSFE